MKIEKCPFCGNEASEITNCNDLEECRHFERCPATEPYVCVVCNMFEGGCGASSGFYDSPEKAIAAWNRRAEPENKPLTQEEVSAMCGEPLYVIPLDADADWESHWSIMKTNSVTAWSLSSKGKIYFLYEKDYGKTWLAYRNRLK